MLSEYLVQIQIYLTSLSVTFSLSLLCSVLKEEEVFVEMSEFTSAVLLFEGGDCIK